MPIAVTEQGLRRVGLLGTKFVMEESFYRDRLQKNFGIEALVPGQEEQDTVHRTIYEELCLEEIEETSRYACFKIIEGVTGQGAQGIVLGCTELPLLIHPS
jgi:aspartate racemase